MTRFTDLPRRIRQLPLDARGYPIPWFVETLADGARDFRVASASKRVSAVKQSLCWICGDRLGRHRVYVIGPMCAVNRTTSEPPCHRECAEFAARACPFLTKPLAKRDERELPEHVDPGGIPILRNPGVTCLWESNHFGVQKTPPNGWVIRLGAPDAVDWYCEGRRATEAEIRRSLVSGLPLLAEVADREGPMARGAFDALCRHFFDNFKSWPRGSSVEAA